MCPSSGCSCWPLASCPRWPHPPVTKARAWCGAAPVTPPPPVPRRSSPRLRRTFCRRLLTSRMAPRARLHPDCCMVRICQPASQLTSQPPTYPPTRSFFHSVLLTDSLTGNQRAKITVVRAFLKSPNPPPPSLPLSIHPSFPSSRLCNAAGPEAELLVYRGSRKDLAAVYHTGNMTLQYADPVNQLLDLTWLKL